MGPSSQKPWRKKGGDVELDDVREFWKGLSLAQRRELLRIDKATLFETVRKNLYCCKCHGLLVEGFTQLLLYNRTIQNGQFENAEYRVNSPGSPGGFVFGAGGGARTADGGGIELANGLAALEEFCRDPLVHPWGGLTASKDSVLTILDCFLRGDAPAAVFESSRVRERERELLYPDACGGYKGQGGGKVTLWSPGKEPSTCAPRHHNPKESCALHKAKLSCEALVDFWGALGEETRASLLRMKEEDFIERLIKRFESKRFCRDCRRNVLREFKEMKELRRARRETRCNTWFCMADTTLAHYEITDSGAYASWAGSFGEDTHEEYARFQWGLGTSEGNDDLFQFEDVGTADSATVGNLDMGDFVLTPCWLSVRGWKRDGRCEELFAKASPVTKGGPCVHRRLWVGDGYVAINKGESIQRFFEKAEEADEDWLQEDDELSENGTDLLDPDAPRQQKHAKSPELARDFLLDAATVIFKEQVEKAFREGTARQNAHSIFVHLSLSLLEEKLKVACREIAALRKQDLLMLEEEAEKREEEERRERKRLKDREKKQRRKGKDREQKEREEVAAVSKRSESEGAEAADGKADAPEREGSSPTGEGGQCEGALEGGDGAVAQELSPGGRVTVDEERGEDVRSKTVKDGMPLSGSVGEVGLQGRSGGVILDRHVNALGKKVADLGLERRGPLELKGKENGRQVPAVTKLPKAKSSAPIVSSSGTGGVKILVRSIPSVLANTNTKAGGAKAGSKGGGVGMGAKGAGALASSMGKSGPAVTKVVSAGGLQAGPAGAKGSGGKISGQRIVVNTTGMSNTPNGIVPGGLKLASGGRGSGSSVPIVRSIVNGTTGALRNGVVGAGPNGGPAVISGTNVGVRNGLNGVVASSASGGSVLRAGPQVIRATSLPGGTANGGTSGGGGTTTIIRQVAPGVTVATKRSNVHTAAGYGAGKGGSASGEANGKAQGLAEGQVRVSSGPAVSNGQVSERGHGSINSNGSVQVPVTQLGRVVGGMNGQDAGCGTEQAPGGARSLAGSVSGQAFGSVNGQNAGGVNGQGAGGTNGRTDSKLTSWASGARNSALLNNKVIRVGSSAPVFGSTPLARANSASALALGGHGAQDKSSGGTAVAAAAAAAAASGVGPPAGRAPLPQPLPSPTPSEMTPLGGPISGCTTPWLSGGSSRSEIHPPDPAPLTLGNAPVNVLLQNGGSLSSFHRSLSASEGELRASPPGAVSLEGGDPLGASVRAVIGSLPLEMGGNVPGQSGREENGFGARSLDREPGHFPAVGLRRVGALGQQTISSNGTKRVGPLDGRTGLRADGRTLGVGLDGVKGQVNGFTSASNGHIWGPDFSLFSFAAPPESGKGGMDDGGKKEHGSGQGEYSLFASAGGGFGFF